MEFSLDASFEEPSPENRAVNARARPIQISTSPNNLQQIDVRRELIEQFNMAKRLMAEAEYDEGSSINQKASGLNALTAILNSLTKMQTDLFNAERVKTLEATLLEVLKEFPELQAAFMEKYKKRVKVLEDVV